MSVSSGNASEHAQEAANEDIVEPEGSSYRDEEKAKNERAKELSRVISWFNRSKGSPQKNAN